MSLFEYPSLPALPSFGYHGWNATNVQKAMAVVWTYYQLAPTSILASSGNGFTATTGAELKFTGASSATIRLEVFCEDGLVDYASDFYQVTFQKNGTPTGPTASPIAKSNRLSFALTYQASSSLNDVWTVALTNLSHSTDNFEGRLFLQAFSVA